MVFEFADSLNKPETDPNPLPRAKISPDLYEWGRRSGRNGPGMTPSIIIALAPAPMRLSRYLAPDRPGEC